jgi:hypothetical protein
MSKRCDFGTFRRYVILLGQLETRHSSSTPEPLPACGAYEWVSLRN